MPKPKVIIMTSKIKFIFNSYYYPLEDINQCFIWKGTFNKQGYGVVTIYENKLLEQFFAHRLSYMVHNKLEFLDDILVLHNCPGGGNYACVNPHHLYLGTYKDNSRDMVQNNRQAKGEHNGFSKLTDEKVIQIRLDYSTGLYTQAELADKYITNQTNISSIVRNKAWKHLL